MASPAELGRAWPSSFVAQAYGRPNADEWRNLLRRSWLWGRHLSRDYDCRLPGLVGGRKYVDARIRARASIAVSRAVLPAGDRPAVALLGVDMDARAGGVVLCIFHGEMGRPIGRRKKITIFAT